MTPSTARGKHGQVALVPADQVPGHAAHQQGVGDTVRDRIKEGAAHRGGPGRLGHRPVQQVVQPGQDEQDDGDVQVTGRHGGGGRGGRDQSGRGQNISGDASAVECRSRQVRLTGRPHRASDRRT